MKKNTFKVLFYLRSNHVNKDVNAQRRAVAIHHLDTLWRPSDLTQRDGNTDLLEKAKLEKRIASLESERKAHSKGIADRKFRYQTSRTMLHRHVGHPCRLHELCQRFGEDTRHHRPV